MKLDAELMFECLIYLNVYYYIVFATCELIMTAAKYRSVVDTPDIGQDASIVMMVLLAELIKILLYRRFKDNYRDLITGIAVLFTFVTILGIVYTFTIQQPVLKLEVILCCMESMLASTQVIFGILQLMPCCKKAQYY